MNSPKWTRSSGSMRRARYEDMTAARAQVERAQGAIKEVNSYISETALLASADGVVTDIFRK